jgi:hypothetical protein
MELRWCAAGMIEASSFTRSTAHLHHRFRHTRRFSAWARAWASAGWVGGAHDGYAGAMTDTKPWAVVTGASSGIGFELAKQFTENGFDLLVTAEDKGLAS